MDNSFFGHLLHEFDLPLKNPVLVFSLILFIILISPILLGRIKIPGIIGLIISGILVGPYGFHILEKNSAVELFSTIGLLYIMFIAGLELDLNNFKKKKHKSYAFGFLTFTIPILIGFPVCHYLLGYSTLTSVLTSSMFATHTLIAYPIITKFGISKNEAVAVTVGGTILTDTVVLVLLAVIMGLHRNQISFAFWLQLGLSLSVFTAIMFLVIPRVAKWFFVKLESEKTSHYVFVLSVVFFAAFLAQVAGVEPIIGAFLAGLALNRLIPHTSMLMNRIEFVGNAIFIPFFLISVGMLVNVQVLFKGPAALIVALCLTIAALSGKWIAAFITQKLFKYSKEQRQVIFGLSSAHAAATLAIILVGYKAGIIDENILNGTIILILFTCIVASLATEKASRKIILKEENEEHIPDKHGPEQETILIPIADFSNLETMLDLAILLKDKNSEHPLYLLSVVPNDHDAEINLKKAHKKLGETVKYASGTETGIEVIATIDYNIASGLVRTSKEKLATLILTGWPRKVRLIEKLMVNKTASVIEKTDKSIFVCHLHQPLIVHEKLLLVCPPKAEFEIGFNLWLSKICKIGSELSLEIKCFCNEKTQVHIQKYLENTKVNVPFVFDRTDAWEKPELLVNQTGTQDLLIMVCARKSSVSYRSSFEHITRKMELLFNDHSKIIIYPEVKQE